MLLMAMEKQLIYCGHDFLMQSNNMKRRLLYTLAILFAAVQTFAQGTIKYEYDANNRLTKVTYGNGTTESYTYDKLGNRLTMKTDAREDLVRFADPAVKALCVTHWDTDGDGELSKVEASAVKDIETVFNGGEITSFNELEYFTGLTSIGEQAFSGCDDLTSLTIPDGVKSIGVMAFYACSSLTSLTIPEGVTSIGDLAFIYCSGLTSITIPKSVTNIGENVFGSCSNLASIAVEEGNTMYDSRNNCNAIIERKNNKLIAGCYNTIIPNGVTAIDVTAFFYCSGLTSISIPNSVTSIGYGAFDGCSGLTTVIIPEGVTTIGMYAFSSCTNLTSVTVGIKKPLTIKENVFTNQANATLYVPKGCVDAYKAADYWKEFKDIVEYDVINPDDIIEFADAKVKAICVANWDTNGDSELSKSEAAAVTDLGTVFKGQNEITSFNELEHFTGLTTIAGGTFAGCSSLTSVMIPSTVTSIGDGVFPDDKTGAFYNCSSLTSLTIPEGVTRIGTMAFSGCHSLTMMTIPKNVGYIGNGVFGTFNRCRNLIGLNILDLSKWCNMRLANGGSPLYGLHLYVNGKEVHDLIIPDGVTYIAGSVFGGCKGLTSVTIPSSVTEFGRTVFYDCDELTSVIVERAEPLHLDLTEDFFYDRANATLYVPKGCVEAYKAADYWKEFKNIVEIGSVIRGDANGDGVISDADVIAVKDYIMGNEPDNFVFKGADANEDEKVNVADIVIILNKKE